MSLLEVGTRIADKQVYEEDCKVVKEWYDSAYASFNRQQVLKIPQEMKTKKDKKCSLEDTLITLMRKI